MKKLLGLTTLVLSLCSYGQGINWTHGFSWKEVLEKAKAENKFIFIDCYATWCGPCKKMDKEVYTNDSVRDYLSSKFISIKVQMDKTEKDDDDIKAWYDDAEQIGKRFRVTAYPTLLFLTPNGELAYKKASYVGPKTLIDIASKATDANFKFDDPYAGFDRLIDDYKNGILHYHEMPYLINTAQLLGEASLPGMLSDYFYYLKHIEKDSLYTKEIIEFLKSNITSSSNLFNIFYTNGRRVDSVMKIKGFARRVVDDIIGKDNVDPFLNQTALQKNKEPEWQKLSKEITAKYGSAYVARNMISAKMKWYQSKGKWDTYFTLYLSKIDKFGVDTSTWMGDWEVNDVSYNVARFSKNISIMNACLKLMDGTLRRRAATKDPIFYELDTYANLLYALGRRSEAISWEKKAIENALEWKRKSTEEDAEYYASSVKEFETITEKMEKGLPLWEPVIETPQKKFSGDWTLEKKDFIIGPEYPDALPQTLIVEEMKDSIHLKKISYDNQDSIVVEESFPLNKKASTVTTKSNRVKSVRLQSINANSMSIITVLSFPNHGKDAEYTIKEKWSLSDDRKQLVILKASVDEYGSIHTYSVKGEYSKDQD